MNNEKLLQNNILSTLAFFQIFNHPLTEFEIWKFLLKEKKAENNGCLMSEIAKNIENLKLKNIIQEKNGFYSLNESAKMVNERIKKARLSEDKYKKALRVIKILRCIPSIKMIGICNSLSFNAADEKSDIDLFIITARKKIWSSRLLTAGILKLLNLRPAPDNSSDKICASFFISEDKLNLEDINFFAKSHKQKQENSERKENKEMIDIYLIYWIAALVPIYDKGGIYEKFINENLWIKEYLPNFYHGATAQERVIRKNKNFPRFIFFLFLCIIPESSAKKIQMAIMPKELKRIAGKNTNVIINDSMLKFHNKDRRFEYYNKWIGIKKIN